jgi:hypothetical protein
MNRAFPVLSTLLLVACSRTEHRPQLTSAQTQPSDDQIAVQIDQRLGQQPHLSMAARDVEVSVKGRVATLRGRVSSAIVRDAVHVIAESTPGVIGASDELVITEAEPPDAESDRVITRTALRALHADPTLRDLADDLHITCKDGIVMIRRDKLADAQDRAVTKLLEGLPGVIVVTDEGVLGR